MEDQARIAKLPHWAQNHIDNLERRLGEEKAEVAKLRDLAYGDGETNVRVCHYNEADTLLPRDSEVSFFFGDDARLDVRHGSQRWRRPEDGENYIQVYAYGIGAPGLSVMPQSSNVIRIYPSIR